MGVGIILLDVIKNKKYDDEGKQKIKEFYAANDETVELPDTLTSNGALVYSVTDKDGNTYKYNAFLRDVSLEAMLREAA